MEKHFPPSYRRKKKILFVFEFWWKVRPRFSYFLKESVVKLWLEIENLWKIKIRHGRVVVSSWNMFKSNYERICGLETCICTMFRVFFWVLTPFLRILSSFSRTFCVFGAINVQFCHFSCFLFCVYMPKCMCIGSNVFFYVKHMLNHRFEHFFWWSEHFWWYYVPF